MEPVLLVISTGLLTLGQGYPVETDEDTGQKFHQFTTEEPTKVSESNLDALLELLYGANNIICNSSHNSNIPNVTVGPYSNLSQSTDVVGPNGPLSVTNCIYDKHYICQNIGSNVQEPKYKNALMEWCGAQYNSQFSVTTSQPVKKKRKCGIRSYIGLRCQLEGKDVSQYGEFPWMAAVLLSDKILAENTNFNMYQCGGSLIHPQVVLTGTHCIYGKDNLSVRLGEWDTQTKNELYPTQDVKVREVIIHEKYLKGSLNNDPALLILEKPVDMNVENVGLICLPGPNENMDGRNCVASGWGNDLLDKESKYQSGVLKRVDIPIVPRNPCEETLRKTHLGQRFKLDESFICAGGHVGKDMCKGDGGSPLVCPSTNDPNMYVQAGIVAWGIDCGTKIPGVYVNVPYFTDWINNKLQAKGIFLDAID